MKLCIVGIGGAGGKIAREFLENVDLDSSVLSLITEGVHISPGRVAGIWLEADKDDARNKQHFFKDIEDEGYPGFFIPHDAIQDGSPIHKRVKEKYGYNVKKMGFVRDAQYLKAIFEIFDTDSEIKRIAAGTPSGANDLALELAPNPIFDSAWERIKPYTILGGGECDGVLFIVSFGGGTGTGFINPIVDHIRAGGRTDFPVFVLGVLTEPENKVEGGQFSLEGRRYLAAISALYDLLTKRNGASGIILIENEILEKRAGSDRRSQNEFVYKAMKPMVVWRDYPGENPVGQAMETEFTRGISWPPVFVPFFWSQPRRAGSEEELVRNALEKGKLFDCAPERADKAVIFCRGFINKEKIREALSEQTGLRPEAEDIQVYRKMGEEDDEILILLRNPYGKDQSAYGKEGTLERKFCKMIHSTLKYMDDNIQDLFYMGAEMEKMAEDAEDISVKLTPASMEALNNYFFGPEGWQEFKKDNYCTTAGMAFELREAQRRLMAGKRPFFLNPLRIFKKEYISEGYLFSWNEIPGKDDERLKELLTQKFAIDWAKNAKIEKLDEDKTIKVFTENKSLLLKCDDKNTEVILEINGDRVDKFIAKIENRYLFSWNEIPGKDDVRLIEFLTQKFAIDWVDAKIEKLDEDKTIKVFTENKSLSLKRDDKNTEVILEINGDRAGKFIVKIENDKLNIYESDKLNIYKRSEEEKEEDRLREMVKKELEEILISEEYISRLRAKI